MELEYIKIDKVKINDNGYIVTIPKGGLQFRENGYTKAVADQLILTVTADYKIINMAKRVRVDVYEIDSIEVLKSENLTLFEIMSIPGVYIKIYSQVYEIGEINKHELRQ